jgi:hypothetical protein
MDENLANKLREVGQKMAAHTQNMHEVQQAQREQGRRFRAALDAQIETPKKLESLKQEVASKQKREDEHTLLAYWKLANWGERFGMMSFLSGIFIVGYLCSKSHLVSRVIDLFRDIKP